MPYSWAVLLYLEGWVCNRLRGIGSRSMSAQIKQLQTLALALDRRDWTTAREVFDENAVLVEGAVRFHTPGANPRYEGIDAILQFFEAETSAAGFSLRPIDFMEDGDRVAMFWEAHSPMQPEDEVSRGVDVFTFRDNRIVFGRVYLDLAPEL